VLDYILVPYSNIRSKHNGIPCLKITDNCTPRRVTTSPTSMKGVQPIQRKQTSPP